MMNRDKTSTQDLERELLELSVYEKRRDVPSTDFHSTRSIKITVAEEGKNSVSFPFDLLSSYDEPDKVQDVLLEVARQAIAAFTDIQRHEWALYDDGDSALAKSQKYEAVQT